MILTSRNNNHCNNQSLTDLLMFSSSACSWFCAPPIGDGCQLTASALCSFPSCLPQLRSRSHVPRFDASRCPAGFVEREGAHLPRLSRAYNLLLPQLVHHSFLLLFILSSLRHLPSSSSTILSLEKHSPSRPLVPFILFRGHLPFVASFLHVPVVT